MADTNSADDLFDSLQKLIDFVRGEPQNAQMFDGGVIADSTLETIISDLRHITGPATVPPDADTKMTEVITLLLPYFRPTQFRKGPGLDDQTPRETIADLAKLYIEYLKDPSPELKEKIDNTSNEIVDTLWHTLHHPPLSFVGDKFQYRSADGSGNNAMYPHLGQAGTEYAKSFQRKRAQLGAPPDAGALFDSLLARKEYKQHPDQISSMLFYLATIIIHDLFYTRPGDPTYNDTSSYLDLTPLYGNSQEAQDTVRTFKDGLLKPDTFWDIRILGFPPGVSILLVSFNRFHNYVVGQLAAINEGGRFSVPNLEDIHSNLRARLCATHTAEQITTAAKAAYAKAVADRDNDLFQTGRLVTCGLYINIILYDYLRSIIAFNQIPLACTLDPRIHGPKVYLKDGTPMGIGNEVALEFNLIYRWHAAISDRDDKWTQQLCKVIFPGQDASKLSPKEFLFGLLMWFKTINPDPSKRDLDMGKIVRDKVTGRFDDAALVQILTDSTDDCAAAFDSGVPVILRAVEILGIEQSRTWKTGTLNEFRSFVGLDKHTDFEKMVPPNSGLGIRVKQFYGDPDNVELYPGVIFEKNNPAPGISAPETIGTAILSDAVSLVRGDRFYTIDYSRAALTAWGYNFVDSDPDVAFGNVLYRLLMRSFPGWYQYNSVYAFFPFNTPTRVKEILTAMGIDKFFSWDPPREGPNPIVFSTAVNVRNILENYELFKVVWGPAILRLTQGNDYMLAGDKPSNFAQHEDVYKAMYSDVTDWATEVWDFYTTYTEKLIRENAVSMGDFYEVDAVADIINMVHANFVSQYFGIPLSKDFTAQSLYYSLGLFLGCVFYDTDEAGSLKLRAMGDAASSGLAKIVTAYVQNISENSSVVDETLLPSYGDKLIKRLLGQGKSVTEVVWILISTSSAAVPTQAQNCSQTLDFYLRPEQKKYWEGIIAASQQDTKENKRDLYGYASEASRLSTTTYGLVRLAAGAAEISEHGKTYKVKAGDLIYVDIASANLDPEAFPSPEEVILNRPMNSYFYIGWGKHRCLGAQIQVIANAAILRTFARLKKFRAAPGAQGTLKYVSSGGRKAFLNPEWSNFWFFPTTMKVHFDEFSS